MRPLSLHQLTILDASPTRLVDIAADLGCQHVCLFVQGLEEQPDRFPTVNTAVEVQAVRNRCADTGVSVYNIEAFSIAPGVDVGAFRAALERGAALGGQRTTAVVFDPDPSRAVDAFAAFCDLAQGYGIKVGLEFMKFAVTKTLDDAIAFVTRAGHANGSVTVDILHLMRNGGVPADLAKMESRLWGYIQICDGPLRLPPDTPLEKELAEALEGRLVPGEGEFPLREFVAIVPANAPIAMEAPLSPVPGASSSPFERARRVVEGTRRVLRASETMQA